eukprot:TRINITY_DN75033_c0_g1_i1.p1 TRINITY_DN75033_c0_g1~~TRINITY_DN75033_c0_g1_i1.p1  ORF type:complete len:974 (+),score=222.94 TRINITY_DN75033_c0_g1_i1:79-3000(+)
MAAASIVLLSLSVGSVAIKDTLPATAQNGRLMRSARVAELRADGSVAEVRFSGEPGASDSNSSALLSDASAVAADMSEDKLKEEFTEYSHDCPGKDIQEYAAGEKTKGGCAAACMKEPSCLGFTYSVSAKCYTKAERCTLEEGRTETEYVFFAKGKLPSTSAKANTSAAAGAAAVEASAAGAPSAANASGSDAHVLEMFTAYTHDCPGPNLAELGTVVKENCAMTCSRLTSCKGFTYSKDGACFHKGEVCEFDRNRHEIDYVFFLKGSLQPASVASANSTDLQTASAASDATAPAKHEVKSKQHVQIDAEHALASFTNFSHDCPGDNLEEKGKVGSQACAVACLERRDCRGFTLSGEGACYLKPKSCDFDASKHEADYTFFLKGKLPKPEDAHALEKYTKYSHDCPSAVLQEFEDHEKTANDCALACNDQVQCTGFSFTLQEQCLLKSEDPCIYETLKPENASSFFFSKALPRKIKSSLTETDMKTEDNSSLTPYTKYPHDCPGDNLEEFEAGKVSQAGCARICDSVDICKGFTYSAPGACYIKAMGCVLDTLNVQAEAFFFSKGKPPRIIGNSTDSELQQEDATVLANYTKYQHDCPGQDLAEFAKGMKTKTECAQECNKDAACSGFTYSDRGACYTKVHSCPLDKNQNDTSFVFFSKGAPPSYIEVRSARTEEQVAAEASASGGQAGLRVAAEASAGGGQAGLSGYVAYTHDCPGKEIDSFDPGQKSKVDCAQLCDNSTQCRGFTYSSSGACYTKTESCPFDMAVKELDYVFHAKGNNVTVLNNASTKTAATDGNTAGLEAYTAFGHDCPGVNIQEFPPGIKSKADCAVQCSGLGSPCKGFTYSDSGACYLKEESCELDASQNKTDYVFFFKGNPHDHQAATPAASALEKDSKVLDAYTKYPHDCKGNDRATFPSGVKHLDGCAAACSSDMQCKGFTYTTNGACYTKSDACPLDDSQNDPEYNFYSKGPAV